MPISVTVISDTHLRHRELQLPEGDILIHCGDMFSLAARDPAHVDDIDEWFGRQKFDQILCVGGNHDFALEAALTDYQQPFRNACFLHDDAFQFAGLHIYGSSWVPNLPNHAFSGDAAKLRSAWSAIPDQTDILITHTPPLGILDMSSRGKSCGCPMLLEELARIAPKVHCFGHIHASAGAEQKGDTHFFNASSIESGTGRMLPPTTFQIEAGLVTVT